MTVYILSRLTIHDRIEYDKYEDQFEEIFIIGKKKATDLLNYKKIPMKSFY